MKSTLSRVFSSPAGVRALSVACALLVASFFLFCRVPAGSRELEEAGPELVPGHRLAAGVFGLGNVNLEGTKATYETSFGGLAWLSGAQVQLQGSATKTVKITRVRVGPSRSTAAGVELVTVGLYTTAATGGTPVVLTVKPLDSTDVAATAVLTYFVAAGTLGTVRQVVRQGELSSGATPAVGNMLEWNFCNGFPERCPVLRGTAEYLVVSFNASLAGQNADLDLDWTEE